jgi:hypothetical protein
MLMRTTIILVVAVALASVVGAGEPITAAQLKNAVDFSSAPPPEWPDVAAEIHAAMDNHHMVNAREVLHGDAMSRMIPETDRMQLLKMMPNEMVPVNMILMSVAAWERDFIRKLVEDGQQPWWSSGGGACACEWVVDRECCQAAGTCKWQGGDCGCI